MAGMGHPIWPLVKTAWFLQRARPTAQGFWRASIRDVQKAPFARFILERGGASCTLSQARPQKADHREY